MVYTHLTILILYTEAMNSCNLVSVVPFGRYPKSQSDPFFQMIIYQLRDIHQTLSHLPVTLHHLFKIICPFLCSELSKASHTHACIHTQTHILYLVYTHPMYKLFSQNKFWIEHTPAFPVCSIPGSWTRICEGEKLSPTALATERARSYRIDFVLTITVLDK